jgi:uroporphyrinogen III methyltransferase/synthase
MSKEESAADRRMGRVYLVGAGPGDPRLITCRGAECLARADLVLYDYLVNERLLDLAPVAAEKVCLGDAERGRTISTDEALRRTVDAAREGKVVVRLKSGDPTVFARAAEEMAALDAAGVPFEIVPGITAAIAAGSYASVALTGRGTASALALVTAHEGPDKPSAAVDYEALAAFPGTLVFYMGVASAAEWTAALVKHAKPAETPVVAVRRCTWPDQETLRSTLGQLASDLERRGWTPPVVVIVGDAASEARPQSWLSERPLIGLRVLVTRSADQSLELEQLLEEQGVIVLRQPAIEISEPDWEPVDDALSRLDQFNWLVFSSSNGVRFLLDRLLSRHGDCRKLGGVKIAAIGPGTAQALASYRLRADSLPSEYRAEALAAALEPVARGKSFLLARASRGREVLAERLRATGAKVEQVVVYNSRDVQSPQPRIERALSAGEIDWVTVTSSAIARSVVRMFGPALARTRLVSISPVTSATLRELGHEPAAEATTYTLDGVVAALLEKARS